MLSVLLGLAVTANAAEVGAELEFAVDRYEVSGANPFAEAKTESILAQYLGATLSLDQLRLAAEALEEAIRDTGYAFYRVVIPAQTLDSGVVRLDILAFPVVKTTVSGNEYHSRENVLRALPGLREGESPRTDKLQRSLAVANLNASKQTQVFFSVEPETGLESKVSVQDQSPQNWLAWVDDTGSDQTGNNRVGVAYQHSNLFDRDHSLGLSFSTSPDQVEDVQQFSASYQVPFYGIGGILNAYAVRSDVDSGTISNSFDVAGQGDFLGFDFTYALPNAGRYKQFVSAGLDDKLFENDILFQGQQIGVDVRSRPVFLRHRGNWKRDRLGGSTYAGYYHNLDSGSLNDDLAYFLTRAGATPEWSALRLGGILNYALSGWNFSGRLDAQHTSDALIPGEQFGIGGLNSLRGISERRLTGDRGYFLSAEALSPPVFNTFMNMLLFLDGGRVSNTNPLPGEISDDTVASVGAGLRSRWKKTLNLRLYYGYVIDGSDEKGVADIERGDGRVHFQLLWRI